MKDPFRAYDIRGIVGENIDKVFAKKLGEVTAQHIDGDTIIVGRDIRPSSQELSEALIQGIKRTGTNVIDIGEVTTPMVYFAINYWQKAGGIMITASHNPPEYNGFKICGEHAVPIDEGNGLKQIHDAFHNYQQQEHKHGNTEKKRVEKAYVDHVITFADNLKQQKIIMDGGNGAAGLITEKIFGRTPIEIDPLYLEPNGAFPNHEPNPMIPKNTMDLRRRVKESSARAGFAWDGDADRFFICDEKGVMISPDVFFAYLIDTYNADETKNVLKNALCGQIVDDVSEKNNVDVHTERVGHGFMKRAMRKYDASLGAEHSAHYYFKYNFYADDGMIPAVIAASLISQSNVPLSERIKPYKKYYKSGEKNFNVDNREAVLKRVEEEYSEEQKERIDGITVTFKEGWFNIRKSNSEPVVRLNVEADSEGALQKILTQAKRHIHA